MSGTQLSQQNQIFHIHDRKALLDAIFIAESGDTLVFAKSADYGHINIVNKTGLLIKSKTKQLVIQASISIEGLSSKIIIENLNLWSDQQSKRQILIIGKQCSDIIIRHCIFSSFPVSMNTPQQRLSGEPKNWINGIRLLGMKCEVINNIIVNVKLGIQASGIDSIIRDNAIQYFCEDAIRIFQHNIQITNNHIYDSVISHSGETRRRDAILLIPPEDRYNAGELRDIKIVGNVIRSQSQHTSVPKHMQGILQGISATDGYFIDITINDNSVVVNSNHGITLNGAYKLEISANKVIVSPTYQQCTPGIKLYLTRVSTTSPNDQAWLMDKSYSVNFSNNQAPVFNVAIDAYDAYDLGHNHFAQMTHQITSDDNPELIGETSTDASETKPITGSEAKINTTTGIQTNKHSKARSRTIAQAQALSHPQANVTSLAGSKQTKQAVRTKLIQQKTTHPTPPALPKAKSETDLTKKNKKTEIKPVTNNVLSKRAITPPQLPNKPKATPNAVTRKSTKAASLAPVLHRITNAQQLTDAIRKANQGDTILILRAGNYGNVRITNKSKLRIKSLNTDIPIQANFVIDGSSRLILLENMQLWNDNLEHRYIIISGKSTTNILIRNCIISTVALNRNTMHRRYAGNPQQWINGIRMLGSNGQIISNYMMNLKSAILESGPNTLIQHNLVQFYSEDGIRVSHHGVKVLHNNIYDSVAAHPGQSAHKDAIQLIPPYDRFNAGKLMNVQIIGNIIQSFTYPAVVPTNQRGIVQGIFGSDGFFTNTIIAGNTVMVNSDHGITLNGVLNLKLSNNRVIDLTEGNYFNPGIRLYLTRISQYGEQKWLANRSYSVYLKSNQAPVLNVPNEAYSSQDMGGNRFTNKTQLLARGLNPNIIRRENRIENTHTHSDNDDQNVPVVTAPISTAGVNAGVSVFTITDRYELERATKVANSGDTILFEKPGHYGQIRLTNKTGIRIRAVNPDIAINAHFLIDGYSKNITIENINIWFSERNWKPVILTAPSTTNITIRNCLISSYQVTRSRARNQMVGIPKNWITGIWLRGHGNEVVNNHIVNVRTGIIASGENVLLQNNLVQYFSQTGIRAMNNNMEIDHNNIYDAINEEPENNRLTTGIQLIPYKDRFDAGSIKSIKITNNVIQVKNSGSPTSENMQSQLQGITMHDGYASNIVINSNTIVVNTEHGITINGASRLSLNGNRVFDSKPNDPYTPGIKVYYTRTIDLQGDHQRIWHSELNYSISYRKNRAAIFNIPDTGYQINDGGGNEFTLMTQDRGRGFNPVFTLNP